MIKIKYEDEKRKSSFIFALFQFQMRRELGNFGPDFFDEIEDLKFNYKQSVEKNILYEEKLNQVSKQFGVSIHIPGVR